MKSIESSKNNPPLPLGERVGVRGKVQSSPPSPQPPPLKGGGATARGFTLLEVLVALGILAVSITAILQLFGTAMITSSRAEAMTVATMLARQKMAEQMIKLEKDALEGKFPGSDEEAGGDFDPPFENYKWQSKIRRVEIPVPPQEEQGVQTQLIQMIAKQIGEALREIKLSVSWDELNEKQEVVVTTHVVKK